MGTDKNIKLHIVTDIKRRIKNSQISQNNKMTNAIEKPVVEPVEEKPPVEKESVAEPESTTTEDKPAEPVENGNDDAEEENGTGHAEETEKEETTLKRKDAPTEVKEDSPKKKKLID